MTYYDFLDTLDESKASLIAYLDQEFLKIEGIGRKMRYGIPFYDYEKWICYLNPTKKGTVELVFLAGDVMRATFPLLQKRGRKMVAGLELDPQKDVNRDLLVEMILTAKESK